MRPACIALLALFVIACRDRSRHVRALEENTHASSAIPSVDALQRARFRRVDRLGASCRVEDWRELALVALNRYEWNDELASREPRAAEDVQCRALSVLHMNAGLLFGPPSRSERLWITRRRLAAALSRSDVLSALDDAISGRIRLPSRGCPNADDFARIVEFAPIQALRPAIEAHTSADVREPLLWTLDRDRTYQATRRAAEVELWAVGSSPEGFARVLEALAPDYAWNDGAPPPSTTEQRQIEEHALGVLEWLEALVMFDMPVFECKPRLVEALAHGRLGQLVVARLDHPSAAIRRALLEVLARVPASGCRPRVAELESTDPDPGVRLLAAQAKQRIDRGEMTKQALERAPGEP